MSRPISFRDACAKYVHRFTMEHVPQWARQVREDGTYYAPQFRSDAEWYNATSFPGENGVHRRSKYCRTLGQTWPLGQSLPQPFSR